MEWGTPREEGCLGTELAGVCSVCQQLAITLGCSSREHPSQQRATSRPAPLHHPLHDRDLDTILSDREGMC
jgi:hypothetical protein